MKIPFKLLKPYTRFQYGDCLYIKRYDTENIPYAQLENESLYLLLDKDYLYLAGNTLVDVEKDNLKLKFEDLYYGDIFTLPNHAGLSVYMKIPNVLKDDDNKLQKNAVVLYGIWRGDVIRFGESQEVLRLDRK